MKKLNNKGFGHIGLMLLIITLFVICGTGWLVFKKSHIINSAPSSQGTISVLNKKIPPISCSKTKSLIKQEINGDLCNSTNIKVDNETIKYVVVRASPEYLQKIPCTLDCGGSIPITRSDYIVRSNGTVENASVDWSIPAEPLLDNITGCGYGKNFSLGSLSNVGKFTHYKGTIAVYENLKSVQLPDQFGNKCSIDFSLYQPTSAATPDISRVEVHYALQDISQCQQLGQTDMLACYSAQAIMRDDLNLCSKSIDTAYPQEGASYCIQQIAIRRKDSGLCATINRLSQDPCLTDVKDTINAFPSKLVVVN
jgi:hypothetical protein